MSMSTTNSDQKQTNTGSSCSGNTMEMREHLFDKVLTPSDVGSRIVIPKQHVGYFPIEDGQNSRMLEFMDRNGKMWRIKIVLWNSSKSYVMTKGWTRFFKENQLVAGDTVSFHSGYINGPEGRQRILFIDWMHRAEIVQQNFMRGSHNTGSPLGQWNLGRSESLVYNSIPVFSAKRVHPSGPSQPSKTKKMRLFGVDMVVSESSSSGETSGEMGSTSSSLATARETMINSLLPLSS